MFMQKQEQVISCKFCMTALPAQMIFAILIWLTELLELEQAVQFLVRVTAGSFAPLLEIQMRLRTVCSAFSLIEQVFKKIKSASSTFLVAP